MRVGLVAGVLWSCGLSVLFGWWDSVALVAPALIAGPAIGAMVTTMAARTLVSVGRLGAIGIGLVLVPICAGLFGCMTGCLHPVIARSDFLPLDMMKHAFVGAWMFTYTSVLSPLAFIIIPSFCLTVLWIQKRLVVSSETVIRGSDGRPF